MKLPFSLPFGKKENKQYFLALLLQDEKIGAVVLEESAEVMHVVGHSEEYFKTSLEEADFEELLETIDKSVSIAEESLPNGIQTQKTVFGVKQDWVQDGKITKDHLGTLKRVCDELSFQPIGFLVFTEAILHRLQQEEGAPVSAVFVELDKKLITISLVRAGRISETRQVPLTIPLTNAVDNALKDFSAEILPSRIILFLSEKDSGVSHAFISHTWSKSLPFLHVPQITVLPVGFDTKSVLYGTAAQMNFTVSGSLPLPSKKTETPTKQKTEQPEDEGEAINKPEETQEIMEKETAGEELEDQEITKAKEKKEISEVGEEKSADFFGFSLEKDVTGTKPKTPKKQLSEEDADEIFGEIPEDVKDETTDARKADNFTTEASLLSLGVKNSVFSFLKNLPLEHVQKLFANLPIGEFPQNKLLFIIPAAIILLILGFVWYFFGLSADVTVFITPKVLDESRQVTFAIDGTSDVSQNQLGVQSVSANEKDSITEDTTGTKETGTPAKGQVTIFSTLTNSSTIPAGTKVISDNNTVYTLDSDISVASSSGNAGDFVTVPNVNITAANIGPAGNLPSGTRFSINGIDKSNVSAKNDNPFSGGTQVDVRVVSQTDIDKISADLIQNLSSKARDDMTKNLSSDKQLLPLFVKQDLSDDKQFSNKLNDEAKNLTLTATVNFQGISVDKNDLVNFAKQAVQNKIPSDSTLPPEGITTDVTNVKQNQSNISATLSIHANAVPNVNLTDLEKQIAGKSFADAITQIKKLPEVQNVQIQLHPGLPFLPNALPHLSSHIKILIQSNE